MKMGDTITTNGLVGFVWESPRSDKPMTAVSIAVFGGFSQVEYGSAYFKDIQPVEYERALRYINDEDKKLFTESVAKYRLKQAKNEAKRKK